MASQFDFGHLKDLNKDSDQKTIEPHLDIFIDWATSLLRRIPVNWEEYLPSKPADLDTLFRETQELLERIEGAAELSMAARGTALSALTSKAHGVMRSAVNSTKDLIFLQNIGEDRSGPIDLVIERLRRAEEQISAKLETADANAQKLSEMAKASQEVTAKIAASGRARIFHLDGKKYEEAAKKWLLATTVLGVILGILAFGFALGWFLQIQTGADAGEIAAHLFAKALILATVGGAVTFSAKQYGANKHNAIQNLHRSSALRTYRALLSATRDEAVHEAILQQAAHAIFSPSETGYSKHGASTEHVPMLQLIQDVTKKSPTE